MLVADDDASLRDGLASVIARIPRTRVILAEDGLQALERALVEEPHVILTDVNMPGLDGLALLEKLRDAGSSAIMLLMTGAPDERGRERAARLGAEYLVKPFDLSIVRSAIQNVTRRE